MVLITTPSPNIFNHPFPDLFFIALTLQYFIHSSVLYLFSTVCLRIEEQRFGREDKQVIFKSNCGVHRHLDRNIPCAGGCTDLEWRFMEL